MELRDIEYFAVVGEHGHLGRAAESLGLSQPALSKSLRRLEQAIGAKLVKRTSKGVEITAAGTALRSHVRRLRLALSDVAREVADIGRGRAGQLRVGGNQPAIVYVLPVMCGAFLKQAPKVTLKVTAGGADVILPALRNGQLDLAIGLYPAAPEGFVQEQLMADEFVVYASVDHRLTRLKQVTIADLARERWALGAATVPDWQWLHRVFEDSGLGPPQVAMETSSTLLRLHAVAETDLLGFVPRQFVRRAAAHLRLVELPVKGVPWPCRLSVRYRKDAYLSPVARRFIELLKKTAKEISEEHREP